MKPLFITAVVTFSGKTALTLGLGRKLQTAGKTVGYFKPISSQPFRDTDGSLIDEDAAFVRRILNMTTPATTLSPVILDDRLIDSLLSGQSTRDFGAEIKQAYEQASKGVDVLLIEGGASMRDGYVIDHSPISLANTFNWPTLGVVRYRDDLKLIDDALSLQFRLEKHLLGVVINGVPADAMSKVNVKVANFLEKRGVKVYGVLPQQQALMAISVEEVRNTLNAQVLTKHGKENALIENLSVGAMSVESALPRFRRTLNKAVITGGDRSDLQAAALETSTVALILSGNLQPNPAIIARADELGVTVMLVPNNTIETIEAVEKVFGKTRIGQPEKLAQFEAILGSHLDTTRLFIDLGV